MPLFHLINFVRSSASQYRDPAIAFKVSRKYLLENVDSGGFFFLMILLVNYLLKCKSAANDRGAPVLTLYRGERACVPLLDCNSEKAMYRNTTVTWFTGQEYNFIKILKEL
uniref:Uncharacterized protein n=1 Tax=Glossina pallidipes TaxID=7398 RepID=A0A1B0AFF8_GLOPL